MRQAAAYSLPDMKSLGKRCSPPRWLRQAAFGNSGSGYPRRRGIAFGLIRRSAPPGSIRPRRSGSNKQQGTRRIP
jgi:hypothetical protein